MDRMVLVRLALLLALALSHASVLLAQTDERVIPSERVTSFVYIRSAPDASSAERGRLQIGESVELIDSVPRWYEVRLPAGETGFVSKSWTTVTHTLLDRQTDELRIHHLNIGTGACAIVECPGAGAPPMIVDCGRFGAPTGSDMTDQQATAYIQQILARHSAAPNVVLSHGDTDHYSLIPTVLNGVQAASIWIGGQTAEYGAANFSTWLTAQQQGGAGIVDENDMPPNWHNDGQPLGSRLSCGNANTYVMTVNTGSTKNSHSLVLMIEHHEFTAIFSGDATGATEQQAVANFGGNVKATMLTGSHHGAHTAGSNGTSWLSATAPDVMIYSAGVMHSHPSCGVVNRPTTLKQTREHESRCGRGGHAPAQ